MKTIGLIVITITMLAGCMAPSKMMANSRGDVMRCAAPGYGWGGAGMVDLCVEEAKRVGYTTEIPMNVQ